MPPEQVETWRDTETREGSGRQDAGFLTIPGLTILAHPDIQRTGERVALLELTSGRDQRLSRLEPAFAAPGEPWRRPLADPYLSRNPLWLRPELAGGVRLSSRDSPISVVADGDPVRGERVFTASEPQNLLNNNAPHVGNISSSYSISCIHPNGAITRKDPAIVNQGSKEPEDDPQEDSKPIIYCPGKS